MAVKTAEDQIQKALAHKDPSVTFKVAPSPPPGVAWTSVFVRNSDVSGCHVNEPTSSVTVYLSVAAKVPAVAGSTRRRAEAILGQAGLVANPSPGDAGPDWVAGSQQSPAAFPTSAA